MEKAIYKIIEPFLNKPLIVSVSGGPDSLVLYHILKKLNVDMVVVHFNHQKREESEAEAIYIKSLCDEALIPYEYFVLDLEDVNFQAEAHKLRRKHLLDVAFSYGSTTILTAHHLNDLAESILMKLSRGSNLLGYSGIQKVYHKDDYTFVKPLLDYSKDEILNYAKSHNIFFFEDHTNLSHDYTRNRFRHNILPSLIEENPAFLDKIKQFNQTLKESFDFIRKQTFSFLKDKKSILITNLKSLDLVIQKDVIAYLLEQKNLDITNDKIHSILNFLQESGPNSTFDLGDNFVFLKVYNKAYITEKIEIKPFKQQLSLDAFNVLPSSGYIVFEELNEDLNSYDINLCYNKLNMPLWARTRMPGDKLSFDYGTKKLKDFYIDKKIPKRLRDSDIIITDNEDVILAVLGRYYNTSPELKDTIKLRYKRGKY